jgi:hypothetical protein
MKNNLKKKKIFKNLEYFEFNSIFQKIIIFIFRNIFKEINLFFLIFSLLKYRGFWNKIQEVLIFLQNLIR